MNERIFQDEDQQWYYRVRGNQSVGPFATAELAERKLNKQIRSWGGRGLPLRASWPRGFQPGRLLRGSATRQT